MLFSLFYRSMIMEEEAKKEEEKEEEEEEEEMEEEMESENDQVVRVVVCVAD